MALVIPDITLLDTCNKILTVIRNDYEINRLAGTEERSLLYILFYSLTLGRYGLYDNVKQMLITTPSDPKHIDVVTLSYDQNTSKVPALYLTLPSESTGRGNSLGIGQGDYDEVVFNNDYPEQDERRALFNRRYNCTYQLVIVSDNRNEAMVLYHLFKNMLVTCTNHLALSGIENLRIGGQDLNIQTSLPDKVFLKAITLNFEYEQQVPEMIVKRIYDRLLLYWKPEGAEVRQGPIVIDSDDSDSDSFT
jgi:hypothetical protein